MFKNAISYPQFLALSVPKGLQQQKWVQVLKNWYEPLNFMSRIKSEKIREDVWIRIKESVGDTTQIKERTKMESVTIL